MNAPPSAPPGMPPSASHPVRRLQRSRDQRVIGGVCGGIAEYLGLDPVVVRVAAVALAVFGGFGVPAYIIAWIVIPEAPAGYQPQTEASLTRVAPRVAVGTVLVAIGALAILPAMFFHGWFWDGDGDVLPAFALVGIGVWLFVRNREDDDQDEYDSQTASTWTTWTAPGYDEPSGYDEARAYDEPADYNDDDPTLVDSDPTSVAAGETRVDESPFEEVRPWYEVEFPAPPPPTSAPPVPYERPHRRGATVLRRVVMGMLLIGGGILWVLHATGAANVSPGLALSVALVTVGVGVTLGAFFGRSWPLIVLGGVLALALAAVSSVDVPLEGGFGERTWSPASAVALERESPYRMVAGEARLDLSDLPPGHHDVDVSLAFGSLTVVVPEDTELDLDAEVQGGEITNELGDDDEGWDLHVRDVSDEPGAERFVDLDIDMSFGEVVIERG